MSCYNDVVEAMLVEEGEECSIGFFADDLEASLRVSMAEGLRREPKESRQVSRFTWRICVKGGSSLVNGYVDTEKVLRFFVI